MKIIFLDFDGVMDNAKYDIYLINTIFNYHKNHFFAKILYFFWQTDIFCQFAIVILQRISKKCLF